MKQLELKCHVLLVPYKIPLHNYTEDHMKPTKEQSEVINSKSAITLFGFTSGSGKTSTIIEIAKRDLQNGLDVYVLKNTTHPRAAIDHYSRMIEGSSVRYSESTIKVSGYNASIKFVNNVEDIPNHARKVLIDDIHNFNNDIINSLGTDPGVSQIIASLNTPTSSSHWLVGYLEPLIVNSYIAKSLCKKKSSGSYKYVYFPWGVNDKLSDEYYHTFYTLKEEDLHRLAFSKIPS